MQSVRVASRMRKFSDSLGMMTKTQMNPVLNEVLVTKFLEVN